MQTTKTLKRILAAVMVAVMLVTAVPFSFAADADESTITDYLALGTASDKEVIWRVLEKKADGSLVIITKDAAGKSKYLNSNIFPDYQSSVIKTAVESAVTLSDAEKAAVATTTMNYTATISGKKTEKSYSATFVLPTLADFNTYGLKKLTANYYLADATAASATDKKVYAVSTANKAVSIAVTQNLSFRVMATVKAGSYIEVPTVEGVAITAADGTALKYAVSGSKLTVALDANYSESDITVKFGGVEATGTDGVYTVGTGAMTIEGVEANPADLTAYNEAVAKAEALDKDLFSADSWAALEEALAVDVSDCTMLEQATVDAQTAAIEKAIAELKDAPADFEAYNNAVINANQIVGANSLHNYNVTVSAELNEKYAGKTLYFAIKSELKFTEDILAMTYKQQADVDAATELLVALCEATPFKDANVQEWKNAVNAVNTFSTKTYDAVYIDECKTAIAAIVAANNIGERYDNGELDIRNQDEINAETAKIKAVYADKDSHFIETDFSALDKALARAAAYVEADYYKDEDVEREEELGGTAAWENFLVKYEAAKVYADNKSQYAAAHSSQTMIDAATNELIVAMNKLDSYEKLDDWDRFVKDVKYFFSDIQYSIEGIVDLLATVAGLLGMLFRGEIDLYGLFELLGVDQEVLDFLISIGIKPPEEEVPEVTA